MNSDEIKKAKDRLDAMVHRAVPSQVPFNITKASYARMVAHCKVFGNGNTSLWGCRKNGARVHAKVVKMNVWDRTTGLIDHLDIPVAHLFCSACDKSPEVHGGDPIWADEIQTYAM